MKKASHQILAIIACAVEIILIIIINRQKASHNQWFEKVNEILVKIDNG